jgi:tRNA dimethylallyltransferase
VPIGGIAIVGTTAAGKSSLAMGLAREVAGVEIVSVDSMAVYREMDLATAKPSRRDRAEIPHHLIDILDPSQDCSVSLFQEEAAKAMRGIIERGCVPILVGGTGLYHRAVIDGLEIPGQFPDVRASLEQEAQSIAGQASLYARLVEEDPLAASRIEEGNMRRIIRALEVLDGSGRTFSSYGPGLEVYGESPIVQIGIESDLEAVDQRIAERVMTWMDEGLLAEVDALAGRRLGLSRTARQAIGYREILGHVEDGDDLEAAIEATIVRTRSFARRQRSWFRRDPRIRWFSTQNEALAALIAHARDQAASLEVGE